MVRLMERIGNEEITKGIVRNIIPLHNDYHRVVLSNDRKYPPREMLLSAIEIWQGNECVVPTVPFRVSKEFLNKEVTLKEKVYFSWRNYKMIFLEEKWKKDIQCPLLPACS